MKDFGVKAKAFYNRIEKKWVYIFPAFIILLLWAVIAVRYDFTFVSNDDVMLEAILSGRYSGTPDAHDIYHMYPIAVLFSLLYHIAGQVPWYGIFLITIQFVCLYLCLVRVMKRMGKPVKREIAAVVFAGVLIGLTFYELVLIQYTITGAIMAATAIFLFVTDTREPDADGMIKTLLLFLWSRLPYLVLYLAAFALRRQVGLFFLPFFAWAFASIWQENLYAEKDRNAPLRILTLAMLGIVVLVTHSTYVLVLTVLMLLYATVRWLMIALPGRGKVFLCMAAAGVALLVGMAALYGLDKAAYSDRQWQDFLSFNEDRTGVYDFGRVPPYGENTELYEDLGISAEEQMLLETYNFAWSDSFYGDRMKRLNDRCVEEQEYRHSIYYVKKVLLDAVRDPIRLSNGFLGIVLVLLYAVAVVWHLWRKDYNGLLLPVYLFLIHILCWCYLLWSYRSPDRVTHGLYLVESMMLLACVIRNNTASGGLQNWEKSRNKKVWCFLWKGLLSVGVLAVMIVGITGNVRQYHSLQREAVRQEENWTAVKAFCESHPDEFFFLDTNSFANYAESIMGSRSQKENYSLSGGWTVFSPVYEQKLAAYGLQGDVLSEIASGQSVCFITEEQSDISWLLCLIRKKDLKVLVNREAVVAGCDKKYQIYRLMAE